MKKASMKKAKKKPTASTAGKGLAVGACLAAAVVGGVLAGSRWAYNTAFRPKGDRAAEPHAMPKGRQYDTYKDAIYENVERVLKAECEEVEIRSADGLRLFGRFYAGTGDWIGKEDGMRRTDGSVETENGTETEAGNRPLALFFHGYRSPAQRDGCGGFQMMREMGMDVLMVDQRAHGRSQGKAITMGIKEQQDCLDWIQYCMNRFGPEKPMILIGISMGAATVLLAAGHSLPSCVKGVVADCEYSSVKKIMKQEIGKMGLPEEAGWQLVKLGAKLFGGFDPEDGEVAEKLQHCQIPVLLIHGQEDRFVPCEMSMENFESMNCEKQLLTVPGAGHGMSWYLDEEGYRSAVRAFCERVL